MKWASWILLAVVLYVGSIGPVAYLYARSHQSPGYVKGTLKASRCTDYAFFHGTAVPPDYKRLPGWMQTFYAPVRRAATSGSAWGSWLNRYAGWWIALTY